MATQSSILGWRIPWTEEPGGLQSIKSQSWTQLKQLTTHTDTELYTEPKLSQNILTILILRYNHILRSDSIFPYSSQKVFFSTYREMELRCSTGKSTANAKWNVKHGIIVCVREREAGRQLWGLGTARPQPKPKLVLPTLVTQLLRPHPLLCPHPLSRHCPAVHCLFVASAAHTLLQEAWLKAQSVGHLCAGAEDQR